ncbi:scarecrow-like protein 34 [Curcuma longa]|uniref:scarecrow-like protein 34 n=1 Tax=Curcuma longa TaxID=136217 RepID=UPI003D9F26F9
MNQFQHDEFFSHPSNIEDLNPGNLEFASHFSSDDFVNSSLTNIHDIQDGYLHYQVLLDQNVPGNVESRETQTFDENSFTSLQNGSSSSSTFSSMPSADQSPSLTVSSETEVPEFSPDIFSYINQMLMDENMDGKFDVYPEDPALLATEKPFYEILGESFPRLPDESSGPGTDSLDDSVNNQLLNFSDGDSNNWPYDPLEYHQLQTDPISVANTLQSSFSSAINGVLDDSIFSVNDLLTQSAPAWQFQKGFEEGSKFLPSEVKLVIDLETSGFHYPREPTEKELVAIKLENGEKVEPVHGSRGRKTLHDDDLDLQEGRSHKQPAFSTEETANSELFDEVLLYNCGKKCGTKNDQKQAELENDETGKNSHSSQAKASSGGKGRGKKQPKKEVVDYRTLLIHCAQSVAIGDHRSANDLLKQIRQYSSPFGDANQRLAACFADGLEARMAGTGSQVYHSIVAKGISTVDMLKAHRCYMSATPFKKLSYFSSNRTIMNVAKDATRLHIIDFGIYHGFQWPCFMSRLADRPGGPPRLRLTGIDNPMPGFRPTERIDETGRRLADYARRFGIPFEFQAIATKWETIRIEDLNIDKDELLVVNSLYPFNNLMDETVLEESPRDMVLKTIRDLDPSIFIMAIGNGSYNSPFFVTRFREVLFYYSSLFDSIETNVPREDEGRLLIEKNIFGKGALNIIACEGAERVERPETYKQWQVRNVRAGLRQLPLSPDILEIAKEKLADYHKDFLMDVDGQWLLQGWKGRITHALSLWKSKSTS